MDYQAFFAEHAEYLGKGDIDKKYTIKVHAVSKSAKESIEKLGGSVTLL